jgi:hypothetical protein
MPYIWKDTDTEQPLNRAFKKDGLQYPRNWIIHASEDDRKAIGLEWVNDDYPKVNERYHRITGRRGDWTVKPMDLDKVKARDIAGVKKTAAGRLAPTDWLVIRKADSGAVIPEDISEFRAATRAYSNELETAINAAADVDALIAVKQEWPKTEEENDQPG